MSASLYLVPSTWDLTADLNGNIAIANDPYATAQDVACAVKLFLGGLYYDITQGIPWDTILGKLPPIGYVRSKIVDAAMTVPNVATAQAFFSSFSNRAIAGQVVCTTKTGQRIVVSF